jgi:protein-S-isoprenylcysteine O-methyltransferase Ste14
VCSLLIYFFGFAGGCLLWAAAGVRYVHPTSGFWPVQLTGSAILLVCVFLFIAVHANMGSSWRPVPEVHRAQQHQLVTRGMFRWARHPMYATFLWASIGTLLATLNWVIAWCVFGSNLVMMRRIGKEERILIELYGGQYLDYRQRVSALGAPWCCLGFDGRNRREWGSTGRSAAAYARSGTGHEAGERAGEAKTALRPP